MQRITITTVGVLALLVGLSCEVEAKTAYISVVNGRRQVHHVSPSYSMERVDSSEYYYQPRPQLRVPLRYYEFAPVPYPYSYSYPLTPWSGVYLFDNDWRY